MGYITGSEAGVGNLHVAVNYLYLSIRQHERLSQVSSLGVDL